MKCLAFVDHDIMCRHFIMGGALSELVRQADLKFVFPVDEVGKRMKIDPDDLPLGAPYERLPIDARRQQFWRWLLYADQMAFRTGAQEAAIRRMRRQTVGWKSAILLTVAGLPGIASIFKAMMRDRLARRPNLALEDILDRERPDVVLHPTVLDGVFINDLVAACQARRIPLVLAMNSWDNPSTKRATVGRPDWLLVWGPQTEAHAIRFIGMQPERVVRFGAAQFDSYLERPRISREEFASQHDIAPSSKIVLFAGSNSFTDEFATLSALDEAITQGRLPNVKVIYRPHPWGLGGRDGGRLATATWKHVVIHEPMRSYVNGLVSGGAGMVLPDYRDTHDLLSSVDVVVSPLSTILVEAMLHGKSPVVFTPAGAEGSQLLSNTLLPMLHFEEFLESPAVSRASSLKELETVLASRTDPSSPPAEDQIRRAAERFVTSFDRPWRDRIVEFLRGVARRDQSAGTA